MDGKTFAIRQNVRDRRRASAARWLAILAAILGAASGVVEKYWQGAPSWTLVGLSVGAGLIAIGLAYNKSTTDAQSAVSKWQTEARTLLRIELATEAAEIGPYLIGARLSRYGRGEDHYVARRIDTRLRSSLRRRDEAYPLIVLTGEPLSGKTRTAFEAVDAVLSKCDVIVPREGFKSIRSLLDLDPAPSISPGSVVFWLDDISDFSSASLGLLIRMRELGPTVCTVSSRVVNDIRLGIANGAAEGRTLIASVRREEAYFYLPLDLEEDELREAQATYPSAGIKASIGQALTAALQLEAKLDQSRSADVPTRQMVKALSDCAYLGAPTELSRSALELLFSCYVSNVESAQFDSALQWCVANDTGQHEHCLLIQLNADSFQISPHLADAANQDEEYSLDSRIARFLVAHYEPQSWVAIAVRAMELDAASVAVEVFEAARNASDPIIAQLATLGLATLGDPDDEARADLVRSLELAGTEDELAPMNDLVARLVADQVAAEDPSRALAIYHDLRTRASRGEKAELSLRAARLTDDDDESINLAEEASLLGFEDPTLHAAARILIGERKFKSDPAAGLEILSRVASEPGDVETATKASAAWHRLAGQPDDPETKALYDRHLREGPEAIAAFCALSLGLRQERTNPAKSREYFARAAAAPVADFVSYLGCRGWMQALLADPNVDVDRELQFASNDFNANIAAMALLQRAYRAGKEDIRFVQEACQQVMEAPNRLLAQRAAGYLASKIRKQRPQAAERLLEPLLDSQDDEIRANSRLNMVRVIRKSQPERATLIARDALADESGERQLKVALHYASALQSVNPSFAHELYALAATSTVPETRCGGKIFLAGFVADESMAEAEELAESVIAEGIPEYAVTACVMMSRLWFERDREQSNAWMRRCEEITVPLREGVELADEDELDLDDFD